MKALVIADVHSNPYALDAIWREERDSDAVYCAGDLVDYGPFPAEAIRWLRDRGAASVIGNHDRRVIAAWRSGEPFDRMPEDERGWRHHNAAALDEEDVAYLEGLPETLRFEIDGRACAMTHEYCRYETIQGRRAFGEFLGQRFDGTCDPDRTRLVLGHTHRLGVCRLGGEALWMNPGSTSYRRPDDPTQDAHYITVTDGRIRLGRLPYDTRPLYDAVRQVRMNAEDLLAGYRFFGPGGEASAPPGVVREARRRAARRSRRRPADQE